MIGVMPEWIPGVPAGLPVGPPRALAAGDMLFRVGDAAIGIVHIHAGRLELRRAGATGREAVMQRAGPGDTLGEASLFEAIHHCEAVAVTAAEVRVTSRAMLDAATRADPSLPWRLAAQLARRLVEARARAECLALPRAADRLLAALAARAPDAEGWRRVGGTWRSFADECGLSAEATYRALAGLEREGRLSRRPGPAVLLRAPE